MLKEFNLEQAEEVEKEIDVFNSSRKELDQSITREALLQITDLNEENASSTVVYSENWHKGVIRSEEHTSELQSRPHLVCCLLLEKKTIRSEENTSQV